MTTSTPAATASHPGQAWVPVDACTLPTRDQPLQVAEFDDLFTASLRDVAPAAGGTPQARLVLGGDDTLPARVQRLADAEASCCSFFAFTVTDLGSEASDRAEEKRVALDIEVPPARVDVLDALVARATARVGA